MEESRALGLDVVPVGQMHCDRFDSVKSWLATLAHADRVITDSFHGTVFSIIFGKPVKILGNTLRGNARIESLVSLFDLKIGKDGFLTMVGANQLLDKKRKESIDFVKESLAC